MDDGKDSDVVEMEVDGGVAGCLLFTGFEEAVVDRDGCEGAVG